MLPLVKVPPVLKVIAVLYFVGAAEAIWRLAFFLFEYHGFGRYGFGLFVFLQAVVLICLGVGILRLRSTWRLIALGCCWFVSILFAAALLSWYFWPQIVRLELLLVI